MGLFSETKNCHVCKKTIKAGKNGKFPPVCPCCGTDLANPAAEVLAGSIECEHLKGALGIGTGVLYATNKRIIFINGDEDNLVDATEDEIRADAATLTSMVANRGGRKVIIDIPLDKMDRLEDCKKLLRKGVTVHTKSGEAYNFYSPSMRPQELKDFLAPYAAK